MSGVRRMVVLVAAVCSTPAAAQDAASLRTQLDTAVMYLGDRVRLTVEVTHAADERVMWPESLVLAPFEVLETRLGEPVTDGGRITSTLVVTVTAFALGELELPSFDVTVADGDSTVLTTDRWTVTVESVGLDDGGDIRDVKGPLSIARNWLLLWPWVLGAIVLGGLTVWAFRRYRRREQPAAPVRAVPSRPPHEIALAALAALERDRLLDRGEIKAFHIRVSEILRVYLDGRFGIDAMELVTEEVVERLRAGGQHDEIVEAMRAFLAACDLVKFARHTPQPETSRAMLPTARRLVEMTRPAPPPLEASAA